MKKNNVTIFLLASSAMLLVACQNPETDPSNSSSAAQESSASGLNASESAVSSEEVASSNQSGTASSQVGNTVTKPSESAGSEETVPVQSETVNDESALLERAKQKISALTGYAENGNYLFIVEAIEGDIATINVRENGMDVASSLGFYRYDDETGNVQEMDIVTGEYVDFPAY